MNISEISTDKFISSRVLSIDALRGFDMCWILGLAEVFTSLLKRFAPGCWPQRILYVQFEHADWAGFRFEDAIFPTFLFIFGVSLPFDVPKRLAKGRFGDLRGVVFGLT